MLIKRAYASVEAEILSPGMELVKTAGIARPVQSFIDAIIPDHEHTYVLVTALSYSEYFGPNSNTDWYGHNKHLDFNGLLHSWSDFGRDPKLDAIKAKDWAYGFPCFYAAAAYAHHKNTDPKVFGFGDVIFVYANASMRRIELVIRVFNEEARRKGHGTIIDRIERGERVDVSMGAKVPFDLCSVCTDWDRVRSSMGQYRPDSDKHPGVAVLREHAKKPIRGLARTRAEYCSCMRTQAGCVLPGGQLVYVYNDFPRFFDISFVIVGADRTSRVMWHLPARRRDRSGPVDTHTPIMHAIAGLKTASMKKMDPGTAHAALDHRGDLSGSLSFHEDPLKMLASMGALGLVASPREFSKIVIGKAVDFDPSCAPGHDPLFAVAGCHVDGGLMDKLRGMTATPTKDEIKTSSRDLAHAYAGYRLGLIKNAHSILGAGEKRASAHLGFLLDQSTVVQWISSHLTADPRSADQASLLKMSSMIRTTKDLEKIGMALDAVLGIKNTSCLWTAMTDVARTTQFL